MTVQVGSADFAAFVDAQRGALRRSAYRISGDWHMAEDLVQTALLKLYVAWPRISSQASIDAYARRTLVRSHIDQQRRKQRRPETLVAQVRPEPAAGDAFLQDESGLHTALSSLPEGQRRVVLLRFFGDLSVAQTAAALGCSQGNVKSQSARGLARLRESLVSLSSSRGRAR